MKIHFKVGTMKTYYTLFLKFMKEKENELVANLTPKTVTAFFFNKSRILTVTKSNAKVTDKKNKTFF